MSKRKNVRDYKNVGQQFAYILDCITVYDENLNQEIDDASDEQKIEYVFDSFNQAANYPYNVQRIPNEQKRFADWLMGLPTGIAFTNYDIIQLGKLWGYCKTEKQEDKFIENYWNVMAFRFLQLRDKLLNR